MGVTASQFHKVSQRLLPSGQPSASNMFPVSSQKCISRCFLEQRAACLYGGEKRLEKEETEGSLATQSWRVLLEGPKWNQEWKVTFLGSKGEEVAGWSLRAQKS